MDGRLQVDPQIRRDIETARAEKAQLQANTTHSWNVYRRLECLGLVQQYLQQTKENPGQLMNVDAIIAGYRASQAQAQLDWKSWAVSYWVQGVKDTERHFEWEDCIDRGARANTFQQSMWTEGLKLIARVPGARGNHLPIILGDDAPVDLSGLNPPAGAEPGAFLLSQLTIMVNPEFAYRTGRTTILISSALLGQIEASAGSLAPELGYSVFHCGNGTLRVYRAVALDVNFSKIEPELMEHTWITCRCAVSSDLEQDGLRVLYSTNSLEACRGMIALEVEDGEE
ncbi:uncharacterized protein N7511_009541 [Penicillium nucicola]|uniref:uncharacterized protein n=1 Tax=Penicillium nucicola TaxID=1850975 RepID=UPI0025452189|nr:uncharacterized protein N7511_009541 [Penicillium nucicola]KAJ5747845.1 hypothetical protein N7511_009541 [Penicillium nucicola]